MDLLSQLIIQVGHFLACGHAACPFRPSIACQFVGVAEPATCWVAFEGLAFGCDVHSILISFKKGIDKLTINA